MTFGFVVSPENWAIVEPGLEDTIDVAFISHEPHFPADEVHHHSPAFLVVEALPHFLTTEMVAACDRERIVLAALITHSTGEQLAIERGIGQVIRQPGDLLALMSGDSATRSAIVDSDRGIVVAVWGASGSPGRTTIALALAGAVRFRGVRVLVIDADPRGGTIATEWGLLDEVPGFLALCRTAKKGILDTSQVRRLVLRCDSRGGVIDVLTGLPRVLREGEISRDSISEVFAQLREMYPITIVDAGSDLPDSSTHHPDSTPAQQLTGHVIGAADHVVAVIGAQPSGVARFARVHDDFRASMDHDHRDYVLNGLDSSRRALGDEAVVREALWRFAEVEQYSVIPYDHERLRRATISAVPLIDLADNQPILSALTTLVDTLTARIPRSMLREPEHTPLSASGPVHSVRNLVEKVKKLAPLR